MPFRLLTWNINGTANQNNGPDQLAEVIRRHHVDLVVLQEVNVFGCTLDEALMAELGAGNYTLQLAQNLTNGKITLQARVRDRADKLPRAVEQQAAARQRPRSRLRRCARGL